MIADIFPVVAHGMPVSVVLKTVKSPCRCGDYVNSQVAHLRKQDCRNCSTIGVPIA